MSNKTLTVGLIAVAIIAVAALLVALNKSQNSVKAGAVSASDVSATNYTEITASNGALINGGLTLGSTNTITGLNFGTCFIHPYAATIAASTTAQVDCTATANFAGGPGSPLSGIVFGDTLPGVKLGSTTVGTLFGGLRLRSAEASSTSGYIVLNVENDTGATFTWSTTNAASGTATYMTAR